MKRKSKKRQQGYLGISLGVTRREAPRATGSSGFFLLANGTDKFLLANATDRLLTEAT